MSFLLLPQQTKNCGNFKITTAVISVHLTFYIAEKPTHEQFPASKTIASLPQAAFYKATSKQVFRLADLEALSYKTTPAFSVSQ